MSKVKGGARSNNFNPVFVVAKLKQRAKSKNTIYKSVGRLTTSSLIMTRTIWHTLAFFTPLLQASSYHMNSTPNTGYKAATKPVDGLEHFWLKQGDSDCAPIRK